MKLLSFTFLSVISISAHSVDFQSCIDANGRKHFTNLPKTSLSKDCTVKDHYALMLDQDYQNLAAHHQKFQIDDEFTEILDDSAKATQDSISKDEEPFDLSEVDLSVDTVKNKVRDILNPDKALEELMDATENRDDAFTRAIRGRAKGIQTIIDKE